MPGGTSPISSSRMVPPSACSNFPRRRVWAPVNAPFSWPKSSASSSGSGMATQLTISNGLRERLECW